MPAKPNLTYAWGETATIIADPGTTKTQTGWIKEKPFADYMNWVQNRSDTFLQHINENGIPVWDTNTTYTIGALSKGSDDTIYKSRIASNQGNDPISDNVKWEKLGGSMFFIKEGYIQSDETDPPGLDPAYTVVKGLESPGAISYDAAATNAFVTNVTDITDPAGTGGWTTVYSYTGSTYRFVYTLDNRRIIGNTMDVADAGKSFRIQVILDGEIVFDVTVTGDGVFRRWGWSVPSINSQSNSVPIHVKSELTLKVARSGGDLVAGGILFVTKDFSIEKGEV